MTNEEKVSLVIKRLYQIYPHPASALLFHSPFELLIATILSAQTTDKIVNSLTPILFNKYPTPYDMAKAPVEDIARIISKVNFAPTKAKNIKAASEVIVSNYEGKVPDTMNALVSLPGVARKTANVVLGNAFQKAEGIVVDTHVMRLVIKLGLTKNTTPEKIEQDLMAIVPKKDWIHFSHLLILYGREYCPAKSHECGNCPLADIDLCPDILAKG